MGQVASTGDRKSRDVQLNIIPFIDLLSCLTAFLLVTAVWINIARIDTRPAGRAPGQPCLDGACDVPRLSVLINPDEIWVGVSRVNDFEKIPRTAAGHDWARLEAALVRQKASPWFDRTTDIEIAADSGRERPVTFQALIAAMDIAVKTGFVDIGVTDPQGLSARPEL